MVISSTAWNPCFRYRGRPAGVAMRNTGRFRAWARAMPHFKSMEAAPRRRCVGDVAKVVRSGEEKG